MGFFVYHEQYYLDWPDHVFPSEKFRLIHEQLIRGKVIQPSEIITPRRATEEEVKLVHRPDYLARMKEIARQDPQLGLMEFEVPVSQRVVEAFYLATGGTIMAGELALKHKTGVMNLGGGFHHAFADHGEGFCLINDLAIAVRVLQKTGQIQKAMIIDCDLHQGNGTARIFQDDPRVFTFSIHQENNYPIKKKSDLDIGLPDFTGDKEYLDHLHKHIPVIIRQHQPDLIVYQAGADPYEGDQLGSLKITKKGLGERDRFIVESARDANIPIAVTLGGGYAVNLQDLIDIHCQTVQVVKEAYSQINQPAKVSN